MHIDSPLPPTNAFSVTVIMFLWVQNSMQEQSSSRKLKDINKYILKNDLLYTDTKHARKAPRHKAQHVVKSIKPALPQIYISPLTHTTDHMMLLVAMSLIVVCIHLFEGSRTGFPESTIGNRCSLGIGTGIQVPNTISA